MNKKKKITLIIIAIIIVLLIIAGVVYWIGCIIKKGNTTLNGNTSKVNALCSELKEKQAFSFKTTLDDQNTVYYAKKDNMAYVETTYQGDKSKFITKNGNAYLLIDDQKTYYTYQNNETDLEKITLQLENITQIEYVEGKEKIEDKNYQYEEYKGTTEFLVKDITTTEEKGKTRFYFDGNKLVYIKTIIEDYEETLKVDISYSVDDKLFEIPSDYTEM